jgi:adenylate cyclase class 2
MLEVEIKIKLNDPNITRQRLLELGGKQRYLMQNTDHYYNLPEKWGDFAKTDEALRLRTTFLLDSQTKQQIKESHDLTYKGPKIDALLKTRIEHVCAILEPENMHSILSALGYITVLVVAKEREVYDVTFQGAPMEVLIDKIEGLSGYYLEAEILAEKPNADIAKEHLIAFIEALGYSRSDSIQKSYLEMVLQTKNKSNRTKESESIP